MRRKKCISIERDRCVPFFVTLAGSVCSWWLLQLLRLAVLLPIDILPDLSSDSYIFHSFSLSFLSFGFRFGGRRWLPLLLVLLFIEKVLFYFRFGSFGFRVKAMLWQRIVKVNEEGSNWYWREVKRPPLYSMGMSKRHCERAQHWRHKQYLFGKIYNSPHKLTTWVSHVRAGVD